MNSQLGRRIRLLHCIGTLELGGEQRYLARIANRLDPDRFDQTVAYCGTDDPDALNLAPRVRRLLVTRSRPSALRVETWPAIVALASLVRREAPNLLTTYSPGLLQVTASAAARLSGRPVVHTIQRPFANRSRTEDITIRVAPLRRATYALPNRFVALGDYYAQDQIGRWRIPAQQIAVSCIGIDLDEHRPDANLRAEGRLQLGIPDGTPLLGIVARQVPIKGVDRGIRLVADLSGLVPAVKLALVGDGPSRKDLERLADELGVRGDVVFAGARTDTPRLLNAFDLFVQTTHNPLNGISSIEAMATGKPILTIVDRPDDERMAADTCIHGESGLFLRSWHREQGIKELAEILRDPERIAAMGRRSRRLAERRFDIARHVRELEQLYVGLVEGRIS